MAPHADDAGNRGGLDIAAQPSAPHERAVEGLLVRRYVRWRREHDGIVAVIDRLDAEYGLGALPRRVVPRPFAERPLDLTLLGIHPAFHDDLGVGRDR